MIYIIRHGQTELNNKRVLQGRSDYPVNTHGIAQAKEAARQLRDIHFDRVLSSPLTRAIQTAEIVVPNITPNIEDRLIEMDYGPYEGMSLNAPAPEVLAFFSDLVHNAAPDGMEPLASVVRRVGSLMEELIAHSHENILISTHAIAMKGILEYLTPDSHGSYWSKYIGNCAVYVTECRKGTFAVPIPLEQYNGAS